MKPKRIDALFERLRREKRTGFIGYITAGDPTPEHTPKLAAALERGGVDLIELGVPFSDPIADGPVIQRGAARALEAGTNVRKVLRMAEEIRKGSEIPLLLFTYMNPVLRYGLEALACDAAACGIDGCLLTDLSVEEAEFYSRRDARPGAGYGVLSRADQHAAAVAIGRPAIHRLRLSGFADRGDGRERVADRRCRSAGGGDAARDGAAAGAGVRHLDAGAGARSG